MPEGHTQTLLLFGQQLQWWLLFCTFQVKKLKCRKGPNWLSQGSDLSWPLTTRTLSPAHVSLSVLHLALSPLSPCDRKTDRGGERLAVLTENL